MSDLYKILDIISITNIEGDISFKKFSNNLIIDTYNMILFNNPNRRDELNKIHFFDKRWVMRDQTQILTFASLNESFEYEIKAICLGMFFLGKKRNYKKLKWSSMCQKAKYLKRFALYLISINTYSFNDLNKITAIELQKISNRFRGTYDSKVDILDLSCQLLLNYKFITQKTYEFLVFNTDKKVTDENNSIHHYTSNSFPTIPDHALLKVFDQISKYKKIFYSKFVLWSEYNTKEILNIKKGIYTINNGEYLSIRKHDSLSCGNFIYFLLKFRKVVIFNTLLFTGMRKDEVKELKNNCTFEEDGNFFVESSLSKTVENRLELSWVSSESCNDMLKILTVLNEGVKLRVQAIIDTKDPRFSEDYITHLKTNLSDDKMFTFNYSLDFCKFDTLSYIIKSEMNKNHSVFKIALDQHDIDQLDFLNCNYKSTSKNSINYMSKYNIGDFFNFSPHQFRHTFAYFMISNNLCTISEIKHQFKHISSTMTFIYSKRAIYSELISQSQTLDETIRIKSLMRFSDSIAKQQSVGGGVKFILNALQLKDFKYNILSDPLEHTSLEQINTYLTLNKDSINFLPHGFCMNGSDCSLKSVTEPLSCINCHGYVTTNVNLPFWKGLLTDINTKLAKMSKISDSHRKKYLNLISNLEHKEKQLIEIINTLNDKKINIKQIEGI
ncbi:site-specific integrase [Acinetobacter sp. ANC 4177]|uniref:site-specific integrase n=1 Tax=Acinetobacter sp. ANC 4177 TaxID=2529838 RepID=UPI001038A24E|nr:site-specific integrase [Acinetobacter sp. ANC 4177]TCB75658.1 site-specific integrase [Acinetobacter sp. ANC 4177]